MDFGDGLWFGCVESGAEHDGLAGQCMAWIWCHQDLPSISHLPRTTSHSLPFIQDTNPQHISLIIIHQIHAMHGPASPACTAPNLTQPNQSTSPRSIMLLRYQTKVIHYELDRQTIILCTLDICICCSFPPGQNTQQHSQTKFVQIFFGVKSDVLVSYYFTTKKMLSCF